MLLLPKLSNFLVKRAVCTTPKLRGYIVLVPEIGEDCESGSTITSPDGLPKFNNLTVENCLANIGKQAGRVEKTVKNIEENIKTSFNNGNIDENENNDNIQFNVIKEIFNPLENVMCELETTWGIAKTLYLGNSSLMPTKYYLNIHDRAKRAKVSKFNSFIIYDCLLKTQSLLNNNSTRIVSAIEKRLIDKYLLEGKLNGLGLSEVNKNTLVKILNDLSKERNTYKSKLDTSIRHFSHKITNYSLVRNFPPELMLSVASDYNHPTKGPWKITLRPHIVDDFLKYCPDRNERWNIWQANVRKASNLSEKSLENSTHIEIIRSLRKRQAKLLGYDNYAVMSMETKMIKTVENAKLLFNTLLRHAKKVQQNEIDTLQEFAIKNNFDHKLELYDIPYWKRKHLKSEYDLDEEQLREYFPLPHVMQQVINICEQLFELKFIERRNSEVWHQSVKYYDIFDNNNDNNNKPIAGLYLDFYSRENGFKNNGWMVGVRNRSEINCISNNGNNIIMPLSALIFNFGTPIYGKSYLLTIKDLKCVFKNFGTALQHLLTKAKYSDIAGLSNIEWDTAEVCGNVMMNLIENSDILKTLSCHYNTEETLPDDKLNINNNNMNIIKIYNNHMAGYNLCKELYLSDIDLELYSNDEFWSNIVKKLWPIYMTIELDKKDYHLCSMSDIFSGDWSAAYFSHLHSKLIADDITNSFEEVRDDTTSLSMKRRFRDMFLCNDGTLSTAEIFRRFRGRDPSPIPLLKRSNLLNSTDDI